MNDHVEDSERKKMNINANNHVHYIESCNKKKILLNATQIPIYCIQQITISDTEMFSILHCLQNLLKINKKCECTIHSWSMHCKVHVA